MLNSDHNIQHTGEPGWLSQLNVQLRILVQAMISELWEGALLCAPCSAWSLSLSGSLSQINKSLFFLIFYLRERERNRASEQGEGQREREKQTLRRAGSLMQGSIPGPQDHDLSQRQTFNHWATQVPLNFLKNKRSGAIWQKKKKLRFDKRRDMLEI